MSSKTIVLAISSVAKNLLSRKKLFLVSEPASWAIYEDCRNIQKNLTGILDAEITYIPFGLRNKIIHFASENTLLGTTGFKDRRWYEKIHPSNKIILTWFHISDQDTSRLPLVPLLNDRVDFVHTASQNTKRKLIENGLREEKIIVVPLGVDLTIFHPATREEKINIRRKLGLPNDKIVVGSFQKDGIGWDEGVEPKHIKGPDIFCDVIERLAKKFPIHVLLTGPARGYVKMRLKRAGIPHSHTFLKKYEDIAKHYRALDLYLITSREEGGPKALLESLASGIPLVATRVGMVPEVVTDGKNGFIAEINDVDTIVEKASFLLKKENIRTEISKQGFGTIQAYSLENVSRRMHERLYSPLSKQL